MSTKKQIVYSLILLVLAGVAVGFYSLNAGPAQGADAMDGHDHSAMGGGGDDQLNPVRLTEEGARTIGVTFATAERRPLDRVVRTVGNVEYDETRLSNLNPKIDGWVERLYIDFTGAPVRRGQPMLEIYSPMLVTAQEELILARRLVDRAVGERAERNAVDLLESARRRLAYWDISPAVIHQIEESGQPRKTLTLTAPASGIVTEKNVVEGARVMAGMDVYKIADLSRVWIEGEVFEKDLSLATEGQGASVTFQAYPGEVFAGVVTYVYPSVSRESRTGRIRVELDNPGLRLRPGMYANIELRVEGHHEGLVVPRSAVLFTGERAVVFMRHDNGLLMPHEVTTGLAAGRYIEILAGLPDGASVVTSASFLIDAESNLGAAMAGMDNRDDHSGHGVPTAPEADGHDAHEGREDPALHDHSRHEQQHDAGDHDDHDDHDDPGGARPRRS
jgi:membrane fusion protein, copper/silver efflux system